MDQLAGAARIPRHRHATRSGRRGGDDAARGRRGGGGFLTAYVLAENGPAVTALLLTLLRRVRIGGKQVHDANIVATMLAYGVTRLLTFNAADFRRFGSRIELVTP